MVPIKRYPFLPRDKGEAFSKLKQKLQTALRGRGSCKRFKEILKEFPEDKRQWSQFAADRWKQRIQGWLETHAIIAVDNNGARPRAATR